MSGKERGLPFPKALLGGQFSKCILLPRIYSQRRTIDKFQPEQSTLPEGAGSHAEKCPNRDHRAGSDTTPASASLNQRAASTFPKVSPEDLRRSQGKPKRVMPLSSFPEIHLRGTEDCPTAPCSLVQDRQKPGACCCCSLHFLGKKSHFLEAT